MNCKLELKTISWALRNSVLIVSGFKLLYFSFQHEAEPQGATCTQ